MNVKKSKNSSFSNHRLEFQLDSRRIKRVSLLQEQADISAVDICGWKVNLSELDGSEENKSALLSRSSNAQ